MFKIIRNNSIKSISSRSPTTKELKTLTSNLKLVSSADQGLSSSTQNKMLPINKLAVDAKNKKFSTTQLYTPEEVEKIRKVYDRFETAGKDFDVPTPWGKLACKEFGKKGGRPILLVHGWLDNLNTWSLFVPHLLEKMPDCHIVCFDEPGCGASTAKPPGTYYEVLTTVVEMRRIVKFMNWDKITLIGHSKGSFNSFIYSALFPQNVKQMISFDLVGPDINFDRDTAEHIDKRIDMDQIFINDKEGLTFTREYTQQAALERLLKSRPIFNLSSIHGEILLKRGLKPYKDNFTFTRDIQWNSFSIALYPNRQTLLDYLEPLECDILNFVAKDSPFKVDPSYWDDYRSLYKRRCKIYEEKIVEGSHYIHMTHADQLSDEVIKFINKSTELRLGNKL